MKITETATFRKSFNKLPHRTRQKAKKQFQLFIKDFFYPSLHTEKLVPRHQNIWSFRIDRSYRVIFSIPSPHEIIFLDVGPHEIYRKY